MKYLVIRLRRQHLFNQFLRGIHRLGVLRCNNQLAVQSFCDGDIGGPRRSHSRIVYGVAQCEPHSPPRMMTLRLACSYHPRRRTLPAPGFASRGSFAGVVLLVVDQILRLILRRLVRVGSFDFGSFCRGKCNCGRHDRACPNPGDPDSFRPFEIPTAAVRLFEGVTCSMCPELDCVPRPDFGDCDLPRF